MKIGKAYYSCRYWGYEPAIVGELHKGGIDFEARRKARELHKEQRAAIKAAGFKSQELGFRSKEAARLAALKVETATGIEMSVFNHDYL